MVGAFYLAGTLFGRLPSIAAGCMVALQPWLVFWSGVLYGPEISATVWLVVLLLLLSISTIQGSNTTVLSVLTAVSFILLLGSEYPIAWGLLIGFPFMFAFLKGKTSGLRAFVASSALIVAGLPLLYFASRPDYYLLIA